MTVKNKSGKVIKSVIQFVLAYPVISQSIRSPMFLKIGVLKNFGIFSKKTPVLESLFNKVAGLRPTTLLKRDSNAVVFL